ncbi:ATP-binding protein [Pseudemcibacter aquimaris]|uniref:ATP-binding protein n=1 Tax=Pseudemcibacter aquimaris TaxID=2857064 RepID=UPI002013848B|nr:ATP-binding protein [Pseudemcibacter aquimaris]MCC3862219.1 ATP-binding protein [Pseudemcibacter aquimaris]WDU58973.1 ATP-binding protein [Pseudemcibacter aquimaris]
MKLKIFSAPSMEEALKQVRKKLGDDAVIIDTTEQIINGVKTVKITAAIEAPAPRVNPHVNPAPKPKPAPVKKSLRELDEQYSTDDKLDLVSSLKHHGFADGLQLKLMDLGKSLECETPELTLATALDNIFHFEPITDTVPNRPIMLIGPPGAGKTITTAKIASHYVIGGKKVHFISTDVFRTGGVAQLEGYASVLDVSLTEAEKPEDLDIAIKTAEKESDVILIDSMGYNPYSKKEMSELHSFLKTTNCEAILVVPAGMDPYEAREVGETYAGLGVKRFITTKLDVARRYASLLSIAESGKMAFAGVGITPYLGDGIETLDSMKLSRLLTKIPKKNNISFERD